MKQENWPVNRGRYQLKYRGVSCLNCGHPLDISDKYCPNCSQANSTKKLTLKDFVNEFLSSVINYDSKLIRTLYVMLLKPGSITKDYIAGKRIAYTNPFRFLLSLAFIYFILVNLNSNYDSFLDLDLENQMNIENGFSFADSEKFKKLDSIRISETEAVSISMADTTHQLNADRIKGLEKLDSITQNLDKIIEKERLSDSIMVNNPKKYYSELQANDPSFTDKMEFFMAMIKRDSLKSFNQAKQKYGAKDNWSTKMAFNGSRSFLRALAEPDYWINDTIGKLPFVIFFFMPIFTVFIKLAYIRKNYTYTDHLIFSFHNQSLMFILLILSWLIDWIFGTSSMWLFVTLFSIYLFQAMRKFYSQGVLKTIIKYLFLNTVFLFLATISIVLLFTGSAITY